MRGLPRGDYRKPLPLVGTVDYIDGTGATGSSLSVSSMAADEFTILCWGVSNKNWIYSIGYNEDDLAISTLGIWHNGSGWETIHMAMLKPYPSTAKTHGTTINFATAAGDNPAWCRGRFRARPGFRGELAAVRGISTAQAVNLTVTPFANPMEQPGGLCIVGAFKDFTAFPTSVSGTGWTLSGNAGLCIMAHYRLSTQSIETPGNVTFNSASGNHFWAVIVAYLR